MMKFKPLAPLHRDISVILVVKLCLLWLAWHFFFSQPVAKHMQVAPTLLEKQFLNSPSSPLPSQEQKR